MSRQETRTFTNSDFEARLALTQNTKSKYKSIGYTMKPYDLPDLHGHFGPYGGVFVAESLIHAFSANGLLHLR